MSRARPKPNLPIPANSGKNLPLVIATFIAGVSLTPSALAQESGQKIEELVITATRLPRTIENIAGTVSVISAQDIEEDLMDDLDDLTRYQPGVTMDTAARGGNQGFTIRGIGGNRVLTVIDDIRSNDIYAAGPSSYGKDSFEVDDLRSVEIIRGPASVLYGADAMGGAVILHSKRPRDYIDGGDTGSYLSVRSAMSSADNQAKAGLTYAAQYQALGLVTQYTRRQFEEHEVAGSGRLNPQDGNSDALMLKAFWDLSDTQQFSFTIDQFNQENDVNLVSELTTTTSFSRGNDVTDRTRFGVGYLFTGNTALFDELNVQLQQQTTDALQHTDQQLRSYSFVSPINPSSFAGTMADRVTDFEFNQETTAATVHFRKSIMGPVVDQSIAYGFNYDKTDTQRPRNRCDTQISTGTVTCNIASYPMAPTENFPNKTFPDSATKRSGLYVQNEIRFKNVGLTLIPGLRVDSYDMKPHIDPLLDSTGIIGGFGGFQVERVKENATSLSLGSLYTFSESLSVFLQYAEGYRPPNFDESNQAFVNLGHGYATVPNPQLKAESSQGLELGLRANLDTFFVSAAVFDNRYDDFIDSQFVGSAGSISLFQDVNIGKARIRGAEISGAWYLSDRWQARGSIAYARGDNQLAHTALDSVDPLTTVLGLSYASSGNIWGGEMLLTVVGDKDRVSSDSLATADSYEVVDLTAYYRINNAHYLRAGIFNVFDREYARWSSIQGLNASAVSDINNAYQPGTNFRIGYNYEF